MNFSSIFSLLISALDDQKNFFNLSDTAVQSDSKLIVQILDDKTHF